jgi:acetyl esterase
MSARTSRPTTELDWRLRLLLWLGARLEPEVAVETVTAAKARAAFNQTLRTLQVLAIGNAPPVHAVEPLQIPLGTHALPARLYRPSAQRGLPVTLYFHGGGWVVGTLDAYDTYCRALSVASGSLVLSVDYRLAPEAPFPAAIDDCFGAAVWAAGHAADFGGDGRRLAVAGDSAGGNLAAAVALRARDSGGPALRGQLLVYPVTDADFDRKSYVENGVGFSLTAQRMRWFWDQYAPAGIERAQATLSVLRAASHARLPPALVFTAGFDPLRDEGLAYVEALRRGGTSVVHRHFDSVIHGYALMLRLLPAARESMRVSGSWLREQLAAQK